MLHDDKSFSESTVEHFDVALSSELIALYGKGTALFKQEKYADAINVFDQVLAKIPDFHPAILNKGITLSQLGKADEAIKCYDRILLKSQNEEAFFNKAIALTRLDRHVEAINCYDNAIRIRPSHYSALNNKAHSLIVMGEYDKAIVCLDAALAIHPTNAFVLKNKGISFYKKGKLKEAIVQLNRALQIKPDLNEAQAYKHLVEEEIHKKTSNVCDICCDETKNVAFFPCGHVSCCESCSLRIIHNDPKCPICNSNVKTVFKVFIT